MSQTTFTSVYDKHDGFGLSGDIQDPHRTVLFTFRSLLDLLGVVLAFLDFHSKSLQIISKLLAQVCRNHKFRTLRQFFRSYSEHLSKFGEISFQDYIA